MVVSLAPRKIETRADILVAHNTYLDWTLLLFSFQGRVLDPGLGRELLEMYVVDLEVKEVIHLRPKTVVSPRFSEEVVRPRPKTHISQVLV